MATEMSTTLSPQSSSAAPHYAPAGAVHAPINYLAPMDAKPYSYTYTPPEGTPSTNRKPEPHIVAIHDGRPLIDHLSLDREGFEVVRDPSRVTNFYDDD